MPALSKDAILGLAAPGPEVVEVPEWGGNVPVRMLTGAERDTLFSALDKNEDGSTNMRDYRARLVAAAVVGEDGLGPMFTIAEATVLDDKQPTAVLRLFTAAQRINMLRPGDLEAAQGN